MEEEITISKKRYIDLLNTELKMLALDAGGVDNWDWYSESLENVEYFDENSNFSG